MPLGILKNVSNFFAPKDACAEFAAHLVVDLGANLPRNPTRQPLNY